MTDLIAASAAPPISRAEAPVPQGGARRPARRLAPGKRLPASRLIGPALVVALWAVASATGRLDPGFIPAPWTVLRTGVHLWTDGTLRTDVLTSLQRAALGFALGLTGGVVLALLSGLSRTGEALIDGTVQLNRAVPTLGLIPLFILWLGIGETFKVAIIAIVVYIPIYLNLHSALSGIDSRFVELAEVLRLSFYSSSSGGSSSPAPCPASSSACAWASPAPGSPWSSWSRSTRPAASAT